MKTYVVTFTRTVEQTCVAYVDASSETNARVLAEPEGWVTGDILSGPTVESVEPFSH